MCEFKFHLHQVTFFIPLIRLSANQYLVHDQHLETRIYEGKIVNIYLYVSYIKKLRNKKLRNKIICETENIILEKNISIVNGHCQIFV